MNAHQRRVARRCFRRDIQRAIRTIKEVSTADVFTIELLRDAVKELDSSPPKPVNQTFFITATPEEVRLLNNYYGLTEE